MTDPQEKRRSFRREQPDRRRVELIEATLRVIASRGIEAASVRAISAEAGVTQGLIRHYFHSKEELVCAAYAHHMQVMATESALACEQTGGTAVERLADFVRRTLSPPVIGAQEVQLWAGFFQMIGHEPQMRQVHLESYGDFRRLLETLLDAALSEAGTRPDGAGIHRLAIACNAVLDGLWLEGSALPDILPTDELVRIGLQSVGALTGLPLVEKDSNAS